MTDILDDEPCVDCYITGSLSAFGKKHNELARRVEAAEALSMSRARDICDLEGDIDKLEAARDHLRARLQQHIEQWQAVTIRQGSERWIAAHRKCAADLLAVLTEPPQEQICKNGPIDADRLALNTEGETP